MIIIPPTKIVLKESLIHGLGVFANKKITKGEIIEECPFLAFPQNKNEKTPVFSNYAFCFPKGETWTTHTLVLGYGSYYNHSENPSVDWYTKNQERLFVFFALQDIQEGEELFINYSNGIVFNE
jgi:SET domain-containing protein